MKTIAEASRPSVLNAQQAILINNSTNTTANNSSNAENDDLKNIANADFKPPHHPDVLQNKNKNSFSNTTVESPVSYSSNSENQQKRRRIDDEVKEKLAITNSNNNANNQIDNSSNNYNNAYSSSEKHVLSTTYANEAKAIYENDSSISNATANDTVAVVEPIWDSNMDHSSMYNLLEHNKVYARFNVDSLITEVAKQLRVILGIPKNVDQLLPKNYNVLSGGLFEKMKQQQQPEHQVVNEALVSASLTKFCSSDGSVVSDYLTTTSNSNNAADDLFTVEPCFPLLLMSIRFKVVNEIFAYHKSAGDLVMSWFVSFLFFLFYFFYLFIVLFLFSFSCSKI
jgi:hypothetical protein